MFITFCQAIYISTKVIDRSKSLHIYVRRFFKFSSIVKVHHSRFLKLIPMLLAYLYVANNHFTFTCSVLCLKCGPSVLIHTNSLTLSMYLHCFQGFMKSYLTVSFWHFSVFAWLSLAVWGGGLFSCLNHSFILIPNISLCQHL